MRTDFYVAKTCHIYYCNITLLVNCQQRSLENHRQENLPARVEIASKNKHLQIVEK